MKVSVIIPTYNEEKVIEDCLDSLKVQSFKDLEIIIADDGSTDKTKELVEGANLLTQNHKGPGEARNLGANKAKGEILVFVDADMIFDKDFIKDLVEPIVTGKSKGTFSKDEIISNWNNIWAKCWNLNRGINSNKMHGANYPDTQKVFRAILKSEFEKVKGFDQGGHYTDDWSLSEKLGYEAEASGGKFYHKNPETLAEVFHQAKWVSKRPYKLGFVGFLVTLVRSSLPFSVFIGLLKSIIYITPQFLIFKIVYDLGIFTGVLEYMISKKGFK